VKAQQLSAVRTQGDTSIFTKRQQQKVACKDLQWHTWRCFVTWNLSTGLLLIAPKSTDHQWRTSGRGVLQLLQLSTNQQGVSMQSSCQSAGGTHCEQSRETVQHRLDLLLLDRDKAVEEIQQHRHVGIMNSCL
jgi:hypothetical protein